MRGLDFAGLKCTPPHDIPEQPIKGYMPKGKNADFITTLILKSHEVLANHEINLTRRDLGENQATHIWLWGQGKAANVPTFESRFHKKGAMITAVDLLRGIANLLGWANLDCPGITSYHDTDYAMQGKVTCDALDKYDIVCCHVEAPDEASHAGQLRRKNRRHRSHRRARRRPGAREAANLRGVAHPHHARPRHPMHHAQAPR